MVRVGERERAVVGSGGDGQARERGGKTERATTVVAGGERRDGERSEMRETGRGLRCGLTVAASPRGGSRGRGRGVRVEFVTSRGFFL